MNQARIIGIDPGTAITGFSILDKDYDKLRLIECGCIRTEAGLQIATRLNQIATDLATIIETYNPQVACVEQIFFQKNVKTAIDVAQARGVIIQKLTENSIPIYEFTPLQIKQNVCGYGKADKKMVQEMVKMTLNLAEVPKPDDAADAVAAAISLSQSLSLSSNYMDKSQKILVIALWSVIISGLIFLTFNKLSNKEPEFDPNSLIGNNSEEIETEEENIQNNTSELNQAISLINEGKTTEAREILINELQKSPNSVQIQIEIGRTYLYENKIEQAKDVFWQMDKNIAAVQMYRSIVLFFYQQFDDSRDELSQTAHPSLYNAFETFDYYQESENSYLKALYSKALIQVDEHQAALFILSELIQNNPNYRDAWIMLGYCYLKIGLMDDAIHALEKAYNLDPEKAEALYYLGVAYSLNGDAAAGRAYINQAKTLGFSN